MELSGIRLAFWQVRGEESGYHLVSNRMVKRRKTTVLPPPAHCPLERCMSLIGGAWTAHVIWYLREGGRCFTELSNDISGISAKMLTSRLRTLEREGVVERHTKPTSPPTVWYSLTPAGRELSVALVNLVESAQRLKGELLPL
jgi:DNA-binding HxlR family transcriptional regulator